MAFLASRSLTVTFIQGSTTITSAAGFVASDAGRQIRTTDYPVYTIASVTTDSIAVLDQSFAATGGAILSTILSAYVVAPADFRRFLVIADPYNKRILPYWISQDDLAIADPGRTSGDSGPRYIISQGVSTAIATLGQVRYEAWPYPSSARQYPFLYYKQAPRFADSDPLPGVFANRADLLTLGAEIEAAEWPGTIEQKNPYYNLGLADRKQTDWNIELQRLSLADDNQFPEDLIAVNWARRYGIMDTTTTVLRSTDATLADYY